AVGIAVVPDLVVGVPLGQLEAVDGVDDALGALALVAEAAGGQVHLVAGGTAAGAVAIAGEAADVAAQDAAVAGIGVAAGQQAEAQLVGLAIGLQQAHRLVGGSTVALAERLVQ